MPGGGQVRGRDFDGDGYFYPTDCNDDDPSINPGAPEVYGDLIDNNCDGLIDGNFPPPAVDDVATTAAFVPAVIAVLSNDSDPNGDALSVTAVSVGANGSTEVLADGTVRCTPAAGFVGTDSFTYTISDGRGAADPLECPDCGGAMRIVAFIEEQRVVRAILEHLSLWDEARPPPVSPTAPRAPVELEYLPWAE